jgi:hypothetical protein
MKTHTKTTRCLLVGLFGLLSLTSANAAFAWKWSNTNGSAAIRNEIANSMNTARDIYNTNARPVMDYTAPVLYNSAVPTADASYRGTIRFGGSRDGRVATHETAHIYGTGTYSRWSGLLRGGNTWGGRIANDRYKTYLGSAAIVRADAQHFWNYGLNKSWEDTPRHCWMVRAFRGDMGLSQ